MAPSSGSTRISIAANRGVTCALFGLAIIAFIIRSYVRLRIMKQFFTEDFMLAFAVICLCGSTALVVASLQEQYDELAVILHSSTFDPTLEFIEKLPKTLAMNNAASTLWVVRDVAITTVIDILTDLIVLSFPIATLLQIQVNTRQKVGVGVWLCLSIVMVIIAIVRIAGMELGEGVDIVWVAFFQQQEASIAVIMVCTSAFRSLFVNGPENDPPHAPLGAANGWRQFMRRTLGSGRKEESVDKNIRLPQVPRATLTGMSEFVREV
ncbi:MAG: hypothetical protein Q9203_001669 [Teloschistes exilis]